MCVRACVAVLYVYSRYTAAVYTVPNSSPLLPLSSLTVHMIWMVSCFPAVLHKQLSVSQQEVASQNQKMADLESQLSQTNDQLASEIKTKDQSIALKVHA